jgi:hypothetical protein
VKYSIAMLLLEQRERSAGRSDIQVFATDVDTAALQFARRGVYSVAISSDVSEDRLTHFFSARSNGYVVKPKVMDTVLFAEHNLVSDPPFSKLDLISCRNLIIYMSRFRSRARAGHASSKAWDWALRPCANSQSSYRAPWKSNPLPVSAPDSLSSCHDRLRLEDRRTRREQRFSRSRSEAIIIFRKQNGPARLRLTGPLPFARTSRCQWITFA